MYSQQQGGGKQYNQLFTANRQDNRDGGNWNQQRNFNSAIGGAQNNNNPPAGNQAPQQNENRQYNNPRQYNNNNNNYQGGYNNKNYNNQEKKNSFNVIDSKKLQESFTNSSILLVEQVTNNNQPNIPGVGRFGQEAQGQSTIDKVQISFSNESKYQTFVAEKSEKDLKLLSSSIIGSENTLLKIDDCFVIKGQQNNGLAITALSIYDSSSNLYGLYLIQNQIVDPNRMAQIPYQLAHKGKILQVFSFKNWIVSVAEKDDIQVKFWIIQQNNMLTIDEQITMKFNKELEESFKKINIQPSPIQRVEFIEISIAQGTPTCVLISFKITVKQPSFYKTTSS